VEHQLGPGTKGEQATGWTRPPAPVHCAALVTASRSANILRTSIITRALQSQLDTEALALEQVNPSSSSSPAT
jgi:hypothetical protein